MNRRDDGMLDAVFRESRERTTFPCQNERMVVSSFGEIARVRSYEVGSMPDRRDDLRKV